jgi:ribonuclease T2
LILRCIAAALLGLLMAAGAARAQNNQPGDFSFYVLSLSWSPAYCETEKSSRSFQQQCGTKRPFAFVVHGLWPQYERGFPAFCDRNAPRVPQREIDGMLDLTPSSGLVIQQWRKHGSCTGMSSSAFFEAVRAARAKVTIPKDFESTETYRTVSPGAVEQAFLEANPGLKPDMIAVDCDDRRLREVRVCMTKDLAFRSCAEVDRRTCRLDKMVITPSRAANP